MQLEIDNKSVVSGGIIHKKDFTIRAGAHIMSVLSGLYKNPIDAMVREYLSNMYDAYEAEKYECLNSNKKLQPFKAPIIVVPGPLSTNLEFHDFGIGMSKETVWEVYTQYGNSTKNDNNIQVGGFGLGSKTAFCYNSGSPWMITSRFHGKKYTFIANVGEDGIPEMNFVGEQKTDELNGVSISIPIKLSDIGAVKTAVQRYAPHFPLELTVQGMEIIKSNYFVKTKDWVIGDRLKYDMYRSYNVVTLVMGNVPYEINIDQLGGNVITSTWNILSISGSIIYAPIGSVDIVPSRDSIKYTQKSKDVIHRLISKFEKEYPIEINKLINECPDEWQAYLKIVEYKTIGCFNDETFYYKGKKIRSGGILKELSNIRKFDSKIKITQYSIEGSRSSKIEVLEDPEEILVSHERSYLIINNKLTGGILLAKSKLHSECVNRVGSRTSKYGHKSGNAYLLRTDLTKEELSVIFGGYPKEQILLTTELESIDIPKSLRATKETIYRFGLSRRWEARVNIPTKDKIVYYLPLTKDYTNRYSFRGSKDSVITIKTMAEFLNILPDSSAIIYGIKSDEVMNFPSNWKNLEKEVQIKGIKKLKQSVAIIAHRNVLIDQNTSYLFDLITKNGLENIDQEFKIFIDDVELLRTFRSSENDMIMKLYAHIVSPVLRDMVNKYPVPKVNQKCCDILKKYGMLIFATGYNRYSTSDTVEILQNYVSLINNKLI